MLGRRYPFDPPLTLTGTKQARGVAKELFAKYGDFSMVVSSPFIRCIETAVEICRVFHCALCVDRQLGEVFSPAYFGAWEPPGPKMRSAEEICAYVPTDVRIVGMDDEGKLTSDGFIGNAPEWPEKNGKLRLAIRVEELSDKAGKLGGANLILVTHGDCVAGCMALTSSRSELTAPIVSKVPYCGFVVLERPFQADEPPKSLLDVNAGWNVYNGHIEVVDRSAQELFTLSPATEKKAEQLQLLAKDLAEKHATSESSPAASEEKPPSSRSLESPRRRARKATTLIFENELMLRKAVKLLESQQEVGLRFQELVPDLPRDRCMTGESVKDLADYARSESFEATLYGREYREAYVLVMQPRRIAATTLAERIAAERCQKLGVDVGYQVPSASYSEKARLVFCTLGVFRRRLLLDPDLVGITHIIFDEVHERDKLADFNMIVVRDLLARRSDLRLVLMSATLQMDTFERYFEGATKVKIPGRVYPVSELFLDEVAATLYKQGQKMFQLWLGPGILCGGIDIPAGAEGDWNERAWKTIVFKHTKPEDRDSLWGLREKGLESQMLAPMSKVRLVDGLRKHDVLQQYLGSGEGWEGWRRRRVRRVGFP
ncbi:unnamed protein product [Durusdinium trenchii]|uniref:Helicase ATP-binding domain-containing protein n=1 Tax=Durusdinium trenchii TaxID=1381693 RepID=A0ABP0IC65_9DINO